MRGWANLRLIYQMRFLLKFHNRGAGVDFQVL